MLTINSHFTKVKYDTMEEPKWPVAAENGSMTVTVAFRKHQNKECLHSQLVNMDSTGFGLHTFNALKRGAPYCKGIKETDNANFHPLPLLEENQSVLLQKVTKCVTTRKDASRLTPMGVTFVTGRYFIYPNTQLGILFQIIKSDSRHFSLDVVPKTLSQEAQGT